MNTGATEALVLASDYLETLGRNRSPSKERRADPEVSAGSLGMERPWLPLDLGLFVLDLNTEAGPITHTEILRRLLEAVSLLQTGFTLSSHTTAQREFIQRLFCHIHPKNTLQAHI